MCGKTVDTKQTQQTQPPWQVMQQYQQVASAANQAAQIPYTPYPGEMVAPVNPQQQAGIAGLNYYAGDAQPVINQAENVYGAAAQPLTPDQIMNYYSPYQQAVIQATQNQFQQQNAIQNQQVKGNAIAQGALGGDREGIAEATLAENQQIAQAPVIAGLENAGYGQAVNLAMQQYQQNPMAAAFGAVNTALAGQSAGLQGAGAQIQGGTLEQTTQQAQDVAAQTAYWQQQGYPFQVAQFLAQTTLGYAGTQGSQTQGTTTQPAPFFGLSDERAKEDISRVGSTKDGQPLYRYRFKGDPEWHVGLIAQDVEKKHPEAVADLGSGYKGVDVKAATDSSVGKGYQFGGSPMGVGAAFGPFDPSLSVSPTGLGRALAPNPAMGGGQTLKAPPLPKPDKPQSAMDMFNQAKNMATGASDLYSGAKTAGNWLSDTSQSLFPGSSAAGADISGSVGLGMGADPTATAAAEAATVGADAAATGPLDLLALGALQSGGRINYPGGLALPARNRINLPMRAGLGMPSFVRSRGYQEGGAPMVVGAGDPEKLTEQARTNALATREYFDPAPMGTSATDNSFVPVDEEAANPTTGVLGTPQVLPPEVTRGSSAMAYSPGTGGGGLAAPPPPSGGFQRTMLPPSERPQLLSGQGLDIGGLHISPEVGMAILSGVAGLLASPSPFPGTAIGQGLLTGLQTYGGIKGKELDIEQRARELDQRAQAESDRINNEQQTQTLNQQREAREAKTPHLLGQRTIYSPEGYPMRSEQVYGTYDPRRGIWVDAMGKPVDLSTLNAGPQAPTGPQPYQAPTTPPFGRSPPFPYGPKIPPLPLPPGMQGGGAPSWMGSVSADAGSPSQSEGPQGETLPSAATATQYPQLGEDQPSAERPFMGVSATMDTVKQAKQRGLHGQAFLDAVPEQWRNGIESAASYMTPLSDFPVSPRFNPMTGRQLSRQEARDLVLQANPDFSQQYYPTLGQTYKNFFGSTAPGSPMVLSRAYNTAMGHAGDLANAMATLHQADPGLFQRAREAGVPVISYLAGQAQQHIVRGTPEGEAWNVIRAIAPLYSEETARFYRQAGAGSQEERNTINAPFDPNLSFPEQMSALRAQSHMFQSKTQPMEQEYKDALDAPGVAKYGLKQEVKEWHNTKQRAQDASDTIERLYQQSHPAGAAEWVKQNPYDPRTPAIKKALGLQ